MSDELTQARRQMAAAREEVSWRFESLYSDDGERDLDALIEKAIEVGRLLAVYPRKESAKAAEVDQASEIG